MVGSRFGMIGSGFGMVGSRGGMVGSGSGVIRFFFRIDRCSLISNLCNISVIMISSVGHVLSSTVRKVYRVGALNSFTITSLMSFEGSFRVVISNSILIGIRLWRSFILRFLIGRSRVVGSRLVCGSRVIGFRFGVIGSGMIWFGFRMIRGRGVDRGGVIGFRGVGRGRVVGFGMVDWGGVIRLRGIGRGRVIWLRGIGRGRVIWLRGVGRSWMVGTMMRKSSRSVNSSNRLLISSISMHRLRSSMRLTSYRGYITSMWFMYRYTNSRSITMLDHLMVGLITQAGSSQYN